MKERHQDWIERDSLDASLSSPGVQLKNVDLWLYGNGRRESITHAWYCHNILRTVRIRLNFLAQVANVRLDQSGVSRLIISPDSLNNHICGKNLPGVGNE